MSLPCICLLPRSPFNAMPEEALIVRGAREHNLRNIDVTIPRDRLTVITGLSGSGKSSLAFDTIYAEGQRRYVESLSAYARQFLGLMEKPDVDSIEGLSPAISIEQKTAGHNPRSTVGTVTEIYDYLRLLYARAGTPHCPNCGRPVERQSAGQIADIDSHVARGTRRSRFSRRSFAAEKANSSELFETARKQGFVRAVRRRRARRDRESAEAQSQAQPQHLRRRRPARRSRRGSRPARRFARDGAQARRRPRRGEAHDRTTGTTHLFSETIRLPRLRHLAAGAGAAALLVQLAVRRVRRLRRTWRAARGQRAAHTRRSAASRFSRA